MSDLACAIGFWLVTFVGGARHYTDDLRTVTPEMGQVQTIECRTWDSLPQLVPPASGSRRRGRLWI